MKRALTILAILLPVGCGTPVEPTPLWSSYFLSTVDGRPLPVPFGSDGLVLVASFLAFGDSDRPRDIGPAEAGLVRYTVVLRRPDQSTDQSTTDLNYAISNGILRINLCPSLALCIVATELVGPMPGKNGDLVLTHYLGGKPGSVYRWVAVLPD